MLKVYLDTSLESHFNQVSLVEINTKNKILLALLVPFNISAKLSEVIFLF